jgi:2,3-bisphosphoglycerate-independent phosphoglycerate mutase
MIFNLFGNKPSNTGIKPVVLLVLDGWGVAPLSYGNAIEQAKTPVIKELKSIYPNGILIASGESVGLPANEVGNTEVGHLTMGAGRVILQDLKRINNSIFNQEFYQNQAFLSAVKHKTAHSSKLHLMGLVGAGNVHSSQEHLFALLQFCKNQNVKDVVLHLFTDGRDSPPNDAIKQINIIEQRMADLGVGKIGSISGRYFAMDRDLRWERTQKTYEAIVEGKGLKANSAAEAITAAYARNETDEFIQPTVIMDADKMNLILDNDAVIFYNFRIDRPRQLTLAFVSKDLEANGTNELLSKEFAQKSTFRRNKVLNNLFFVTMTEYQKTIPVSAIGFPPEAVVNPLAKVLSDKGLMQMHLAESEKERFVTYYFNGLKEGKYPNEDVIIVPSPKVPTYDKKPEMSVHKLVSEFEKAIRTGKYHFFVMNFANPDMVAHTGNIKATKKALEHTDKAISKVVKAVESQGGTLIITADHGNAEELITFPTQSFFFTTSKGSVNTDHSNNPVPIIVVKSEYKGQNFQIQQGSLSDISPTILAMMNIDKPVEMTGKNLLENFKPKP